MNGLDLDALRAGWSSHQQQLDASLTLNAQTLRAALRQRTGAAFRRHRKWLLASIIGATLTLAALLTFIVLHRDDSIYRLLATPLALLALAELIVDLRQWRALSSLDLCAPVLQVQAVLDRLRGRALRLARWVLLSSVLLWLPLLLVLVKGLSGVDLLDHLHPSVIYVNLLVGVLFVPLALLVMRWANARFAQRPGYQRFLDDVAGGSFGQVRQRFDAQREFEHAVDSGDLRFALADRGDPALLAAIEAPMRTLRRRLTLALIVYVGLLLATGAFNAVNGGLPQFLIPALLLHFSWLGHLVLAIVQRARLARWRVDDGSISGLRRLLQSMLGLRQRCEYLTLAATPVLLVAALQVLTRAVTGENMLARLAPLSMTLLALSTIAACMWLALRLRAPLGRSLSAAADAISLGTGVAARRLLTLIERN